MENVWNPQRSTLNFFRHAPLASPPSHPHLLQAKAAKERADAAAVEKEAAEKAAAEAIVYIECPYCRQICYEGCPDGLLSVCVAGIKIGSIGRFSTIPWME